MRTVLTVEDNPFFARIYKAVLAPLGCRVVNAETVARAQDVLARERPHLAIVDVRLPDGSGLAVIRAIRQQPVLREMPVITITTRAGGDQEREAFEAGTTAFLPKPLNIDDFKVFVGRYLPPAA